MKQGIRNFWIFGSLAIGCLGTSRPISAQIVPDATLPVNSAVTPQGNTITITGGTSAVANLFHSFREFSLPAGSTAHFNNSLDIQNIITRVTGGSISNIDGIIKANGPANLFLLNPSGIIFGPNASLNIGGSFLGTTASSIKFADGTEFSATNPAAPPLLTVNVPVGLQLGQNPGGIVVRGAGHNMSIDSETGAIIRDKRPAGLQVSAGQTLALVGGDISLVGGNITAEEGRIDLLSAGALSYVTLTPNSAGWVLDYSGVGNFQDIQLSQAASADVSGRRVGTIQVRGRRVTLSDGSVIIGLTEGANQGGTLSVRAAESVEAIGTTPDGKFPSGLSADVNSDATGKGGDLTVETGRLTLADGAVVSADTSGAGDGGTVTVRATESVELIGISSLGLAASGLSTSTAPNSTGKGGNLTVETGRLTLRDGAVIYADTYGAGDAGTLTVRARESVELIGSALFADVNQDATGNGGNLTVETGRLTLRDGAVISTDTYGAGDAGTLTVRARESVELIGSSLFADVNQDATGNGGDLRVETGRLTLRDGAQISASTYGAGDAGTLTVRARESADVIGSFLLAGVNSDATGSGGNLTVETGRLTLADGARIAASTFGAGDAGTLTVRARESVELIGSFLLAGVNSDATGSGGNLTVETGRLILADGARVSASSLATGAAGNLTVSASAIRLDNRAAVRADTRAGGGNITLNAGSLTLRRNSAITTNAQGSSSGGNINLNTDTLAALENSDISANSEESFGGRVTISAQGIFGTQYRQLPTSNSDITATGGNPQLNGAVTVNTPDADPTSGLVQLQSNLVDVSGLINYNPCSGIAKGSSFAITGRGGIPKSPSEPLTGGTPLIDLGSPPQSSQPSEPQTLPKSPNPGSQSPLVEAQGWVISPGGEIILTANPPAGTPHRTWQPPSACPQSR